MTTRIRLKAISPTIDATGVYADGKELPVGHIITLPEGVTLETSGYANRAELVDGEKTGDHVAATAFEGDPNGGAEKPTPLGETEKAKIEAGDPVSVAGVAHAGTDADLSIKRYSAAPTDSPGWWVITDETGAEIPKKVRPADGTAFNDMSPEEQAAEVAKLTA